LVMSERGVLKAVTELEKAGYVVRSARNHINPQGGRGTCFAVCPPDGLAWPDLIAWARLNSGHDETSVWYTIPSTLPEGEPDGGSDETPRYCLCQVTSDRVRHSRCYPPRGTSGGFWRSLIPVPGHTLPPEACQRRGRCPP
jgi:hypothetical protein